YFMNKRLKHGGTNKMYFLRLFRSGIGRVENTNMDEHVVLSGKICRLKYGFVHYDYKGLDDWLKKHIWYSGREVVMYSEREYEALSDGKQKRKRGFYYKLPLFLRAKLYYIYRYYFQLGFLDGKEGKVFCFLQAYWYRFLVDAKIYETKKEKKK
ncbi:MAG: glycosyltransferase family 2 protein, partial [Clostridia bacterium]|nr:glycosyltransferase family 2 protein [Clostridia bacterium]